MRADLREFIRPGAFDIAINMYTSFGYCKTIEEDALIISNIAQSLKEGGCFILEMLGREIAVRDFTAGEWFERAGYTVLTDFMVEGAWEGLRSHWQLYSKTASKPIIPLCSASMPLPNYGSLCCLPVLPQSKYTATLTAHPIMNVLEP